MSEMESLASLATSQGEGLGQSQSDSGRQTIWPPSLMNFAARPWPKWADAY